MKNEIASIWIFCEPGVNLRLGLTFSKKSKSSSFLCTFFIHVFEFGSCFVLLSSASAQVVELVVETFILLVSSQIILSNQTPQVLTIRTTKLQQKHTIQNTNNRTNKQNNMNISHGNDQGEEPVRQEYNFLQRQAMRMARWPKSHFWVAFLVSFGLSFIGMAFGDFSVSTEGGGWESRGTLIADRQTQLLMITEHEDILTAAGNDAAWEELINNVQPGWEEDELNDDRRLVESETVTPASITKGHGRGRTSKRELPPSAKRNHLSNFLARRLQEEGDDGSLAGCDTDWYFDGRMDNETRLWPVWKVATRTDTALDPEILEELCLAEETTQRVLEEKGLCFGCEDSAARKCLPPHSIVLYARAIVTNGMTLSCGELANAWAPYQQQTEAEWKECVEFIEDNPEASTDELAEHCHEYFFPSMLDEFFDNTGNVEYTSSIFATTEAMVDDLYEINGDFGKGGNRIEASYDTQDEDFVNLLAEGAIGTDMLLATGSALTTAIAILVHTRSPRSKEFDWEA